MAGAHSKIGNAWDLVPGPLRSKLQSEPGKRFLRFVPVSLAALASSQITLALLVGVAHVTAGVAAFVASIVGAGVSYVLSRWAWERKGRPNLLKETLPFLGISLVAGAILTETSHFASVIANDHGMHGLERAVFLQGIYLTANCFTFLMRFVIFHYLLFADRDRAAEAAS